MIRFLAAIFLGILPLSLMSCQVKTELPLPTSSLAEILPDAYPVLQSENSAYPIAEGGQNLPTQITPNPPTDAPEPEAGKASISGTLYSPTQKMVIPGTQFYLPPGWGVDNREVPPAFLGPTVDKGDITSSSDIQGNFAIPNILPWNYYLVVWAPLTWDVAQISETDTQPLLLEIKSDQKYPYGIVYVSW